MRLGASPIVHPVAKMSLAIACLLYSLLAMSCNGREIQLSEAPDSAPKLADSSPVIQYEEGYTVQTVLDGNKLDVSFYSTVAVVSGDYVYALDSTASKLLKIQLPFGENAAGEITEVVGGQIGYADGLGTAAMMNHPKGLTIDGYGNVYVADVTNRVIRKVTPQGYVSTIAGQPNTTGSVDGDGNIALFSADFDIDYVPNLCSILISDRGNRRLRLIELESSKECNKKKSSGIGFVWTIVEIVYTVSVTVVMSGTGLIFCLERHRRGTVPTSLVGTPDMIDFSENAKEEHCRQLLPDEEQCRQPLTSLSLPTVLGGSGATDLVPVIPSENSPASPDVNETALITGEECSTSDSQSLWDESVDNFHEGFPSGPTVDAPGRRLSLEEKIKEEVQQFSRLKGNSLSLGDLRDGK